MLAIKMSIRRKIYPIILNNYYFYLRIKFLTPFAYLYIIIAELIILK